MPPPGPDLIIDPLITFQLVQLPAFWDVVPAPLVADIRTTEVEPAAAKALTAAMGRICAGCESLSAIMLPVHNKLWDRLVVAFGADPAMKERFRRFVKGRRGRVGTVTVYYKDPAGQTRREVL